MMRRNIPRTSDAQRLRERVQIQNTVSHQIRQSWLSVIIGSIGLLAGILVIIWNEAKIVNTTKALEESISAVMVVAPDAPIDERKIGIPLYMTGAITVQEPLTDVDYGISVLAVKLKRRVQMYQWIEEETVGGNLDGDLIDTSYYYYTDWKDKLVDSSLFATSVSHWNPKEFPVKSQIQINENVRIGNYELGSELKSKFTNYIDISSDERPERTDIKLHSGLYYHAQDIWKPEVGDLRIQFYYAGHHGEVVTIVGRLDSSMRIVPYTTDLGESILLLRLGYVSLEDIFAQEQAYNRFITWIYRGGAWLLLYMGCVCLANTVSVVVNHSRLLADLLPDTSLKMTLSMSLFLFVTALSWIWYRPALGVSLVVVVLIMLYTTKSMAPSRNNQIQYNRL